MEDRRLLATFPVTNNLDSSVTGSLRWAIGEANSLAGPDLIQFDSSFLGSQKTINVINGPLSITDDVQIIGPSNGVKLQGSINATVGLDFQITAGSNNNQSRISNLVISGFDDGIRVRTLQSSDTLIISNNTFETNDDAIDIFPTGAALVLVEANTIRNNSQHGIHAHNGGGSGVALSIVNNTITGSGFAGIKYDFFNAFIDIAGNRIGITDSGTASSNDIGIWIKDSSSTAPSAIFSNVISGNQGVNDDGIGIVLERSQFPQLLINSNNIGTSSSGSVIPGLGNEIGITAQFNSSFNAIVNNLIAGNGDGITFFQSDGSTSTNIVGEDGFTNTIALNTGVGIRIGEDSDGISIQHNFIGTNSSSTSGLGNGSHGILIEQDVDNSLIQNNVIGHNLGGGIIMASNTGTRNTIFNNALIRNLGFALDLGDNGFTPNDNNDVDPGPNKYLNYPVISESGITSSGGNWTIPYSLDVDATGRYQVALYLFIPATGTGGEYIPLASEIVSVNGLVTTGNMIDHQDSLSVPQQVLFSGERIVAVLTGLNNASGQQTANSGNTSEFSPPAIVGTPATGAPKVTNVLLSGTSWSRAPYSFKDIINDSFGSVAGRSEQLRPIATQNANTIQIEFNEHVRKRLSSGTIVDIDASVFELKRTRRNANGSITNESVSPTGFSYDPFKNIATWTFPDLADGKYAIHLKAAAPGVEGIVDASGNRLNAEWNNVISGTPDQWENHPARPFTTGDATAGTAGNEFRFHFALLKGDYNGDGVVTSADTVSSLNPYSDGNGDGIFTTTGSNSDITVRDANLNVALPLRKIGGADLNYDEKVDNLDLVIWQTGYGGGMAGDVDGDGDTDGADFLLWQRTFGSYSAWGEPPSTSFAAAFAATYGLTLEELTTGLPPQVMNVIISGSQSVHDPYSFDTVDGSGAQLASVPVGPADTISIAFSEAVNLSAEALIVVGLTTANVPQLAEFIYDAATYTATWRFEGWALADNYLLYLSDSITDVDGNFLDGEWTNPASISTTNSLVSTFPSGDGISGGNFQFVMTLMPDVNQDNIVNYTDYYTAYYGELYGVVGDFSNGDFNGNGVVDQEDVDLVNSLLWVSLQSISILTDLNGDMRVDAVDLAIVQNNYGMTGATWADGDLDGNGTIDDSDLDLAFAQFGLGFDFVW